MGRLYTCIDPIKINHSWIDSLRYGALMTALGREVQWVAATQPWKNGGNPGVLSEVNAIHVKVPHFQVPCFDIFDWSV